MKFISHIGHSLIFKKILWVTQDPSHRHTVLVNFNRPPPSHVFLNNIIFHFEFLLFDFYGERFVLFQNVNCNKKVLINWIFQFNNILDRLLSKMQRSKHKRPKLVLKRLAPLSLIKRKVEVVGIFTPILKKKSKKRKEKKRKGKLHIYCLHYI